MGLSFDLPQILRALNPVIYIGTVMNRCEIYAIELTVSVSIVKLYTSTFVL